MATGFEEVFSLSGLRLANEARQQEWDNGSEKLGPLFKAVELGGEAGEVLNVVKKLERQRLGIVGSRDSLQHLAHELADLIISADLLAAHYGIDLDYAVIQKFNLTSAKHGFKTIMKHVDDIDEGQDPCEWI